MAIAAAGYLLHRPGLASCSVELAPAAESPPRAADDVLVVIWSGDGGWADLDRQLGKAFAARGLPVLGIDTFRYFWRERPPAATAAEFAALLDAELARRHKRRVWLIGFSFGADVLPSVLDRMPPPARQRITRLDLLSPSRDTTFEIQFEGYMADRGRLRAWLKPWLERLNPVPVLDALPPLVALGTGMPTGCWYGRAEAADSLCTRAGLPTHVEVHAEAGGHHFDEGYQALAASLLRAWEEGASRH